jgi:hypothetical protein
MREKYLQLLILYVHVPEPTTCRPIVQTPSSGGFHEVSKGLNVRLDHEPKALLRDPFEINGGDWSRESVEERTSVSTGIEVIALDKKYRGRRSWIDV